MQVIKLNDISDNLLILHKATIDKLYQLENSADCIALYVFYYKTAKWQKTNVIKASDEYVKKCLKWGNEKIRKTKQTLKNACSVFYEHILGYVFNYSTYYARICADFLAQFQIFRSFQITHLNNRVLDTT